MKAKALFLTGVIMFATTQPARAEERKFSSWDQACKSAESLVQEGDLIFLDIPNFIFRNIAKNTKTWTSHVGIVFKNQQGDWIVSQSKVPISKEVTLCEYLKSSSNYLFEIRRLNGALSEDQIKTMKAKADSMLGRLYTFGFDFDSKRLFCSKFAYLTYEAIGIQLGELQTFKQLKEADPAASDTFWKFWFLGSIPWKRRTVTPASQLVDPKFFTVLKSGIDSDTR